MQTTEVAVETQAAHPLKNSGEVQPIQKTGIEIVCSASLPSRFFHGPRRQRHVFIWNDNDVWAWRVESAMR
jgi:hypothetical protein